MAGVRSTIARVVALTLTFALAVPMMAPAPAAAASGFTGGPLADSALYVPNDHTPVGLRWDATIRSGETSTGLAPDAVYYVKIRLSPNEEPAGNQNRGFTWNPDANGDGIADGGKWVQERDDWTSFPKVTTNGSGVVSQQWTFFKFGDELKSGQYYLLVSLSTGNKGTTFNAAPMPVMVLDMKTNGTRVHNGIVSGAAADKRAELTAFDATTTVYSLSKTEASLVDDNSDGQVDDDGDVDDEDQGPEGLTGDYHMAAPLGMSFNLLLNRQRKVSSVTLTVADQDIAIGATDMNAPSAPSMLTANAAWGETGLDWAAATDDTGVDGYNVYRWVEPSPGVPYTPVRTLIATTAAGVTEYTDSDVSHGVEYGYEVRAVDAATNVSARSGAVNVVGMKDAVAPVANVTSPVFASTGSALGYFKVTWSATDAAPSSGTLRYDVEMWRSNTGAWERLYSGTGRTYTTIKNAALGSTSRFRVRAKDAAGNTGAWSARSVTMRPYDQGAFSFSRGWSAASYAGYYRGTARYTREAKASATFKFTGGDNAYLIASKSAKRGKFKVYIDGSYHRTVSLYSATTTHRQAIWLGGLTGSGSHTIKLVAVPVSGRTRVDVDGIAIRR